MAADGKLTVALDADVLEQARDAVQWLRRNGDPDLGDITLRRLVEDGLRDQLTRYRDAHQLTEGFPARAGNLRPGRPIST